jgi:hemerythrin-like domain-containing protein
MDPMASGLRYRIRRAARQISEQHRHMNELLREINEALAEGARERLMDLLVRYRGAMDAHFTLEDSVFFPALHGLHPKHADELDLLSHEHQGFAVELGRLRRFLEEGRLDAFSKTLQDFVNDVTRHEAREERLVQDLADLLTSAG